MLLWLVCRFTDGFGSGETSGSVQVAERRELVTSGAKVRKRHRTPVGAKWRKKQTLWLFASVLLLSGDIYKLTLGLYSAHVWQVWHVPAR